MLILSSTLFLKTPFWQKVVGKKILPHRWSYSEYSSPEYSPPPGAARLPVLPAAFLNLGNLASPMPGTREPISAKKNPSSSHLMCPMCQSPFLSQKPHLHRALEV